VWVIAIKIHGSTTTVFEGKTLITTLTQGWFTLNRAVREGISQLPWSKTFHILGLHFEYTF